MIETPDISLSTLMDGGGGEKTWDSVEESWVVEHAKEVQRMMPGGLMVMGIFFFCPSEQVSVGGAKSSMAYSILRKIARFQAAVQAGDAGTEVDVGSERLFLHMCSKTRRNSCKAFQIKDASKGGHPAELKPMPDVAAAFVRVSSRFSFNLCVPLPSKGADDAPLDSKALSSLVLSEVRRQLSCVWKLVATVDGALANSEPLGGVAGGGGGAGKSGKKAKSGASALVEPMEVQLYSRGDGGLRARGGGGGHVAAGTGDVLKLEGDVAAVAVILSNESSAAAAQAIREDIAQTLCTRIDMLLEDWALQEEEGGASPGSLPATWCHLASQIFLTSHLFLTFPPLAAYERLPRLASGRLIRKKET